jgi:hypothetical protein
LNNVASGITYGDTITLELVDYDDNVMVLDSASNIEIKPKTSNQTVLGTTSIKVTNGVAIFDDLIFQSAPGDTNIEFEVTSSALDEIVLQLQYNSNWTQSPIVVSFRYCQPGEIERENI